MKVTKRQLRRIIREEKRRLIQEGSSYEEIKRIRDSGDYSWRDMEWEVVDLMGSMQTFPAQDVVDIMYSALDAEDRQDDGFWHMMLSDGGHLYEALDGLKNTADEEYDPDIPMSEGFIGFSASPGIKVKSRAHPVVAAAILDSEKTSVNELGIDRMTSGDRDPRLEDVDDMSLGEETLAKMVSHLQALNDLVTSEAGRRTIGGKKEADQIKALLPWAQDYLAYWKS
jgi:hypothetical protein